jgi:hypothetical protein
MEVQLVDISELPFPIEFLGKFIDLLGNRYIIANVCSLDDGWGNISIVKLIDNHGQPWSLTKSNTNRILCSGIDTSEIVKFKEVLNKYKYPLPKSLQIFIQKLYSSGGDHCSKDTSYGGARISCKWCCAFPSFLHLQQTAREMAGDHVEKEDLRPECRKTLDEEIAETQQYLMELIKKKALSS